ncbi:MAG: creatininase family protein [Planctomycetota bacterium]|nr:creatininase family protein [Planctomycetota bacterium]
MRHWILAETNYGHLREQGYDVAVLPLGATEPHNLHLPYGTDIFEADEIAARAGEAAWNLGARVVVLPTIPFGTQTNQHAFPLAMNLYPSTLCRVISDLVESVHRAGISKLLILNSHGGNELKSTLRELVGGPVHLFLCDWFRSISADVQAELFTDPGDHAGEMETALALAYFPDLVDHDPQPGALTADAGDVRSTRFEAINRGWISITRPWHLLTTNTGVGNPHPATAESGRKLMDTIVERLSGFLVDLASSELDDDFPYSSD